MSRYQFFLDLGKGAGVLTSQKVTLWDNYPKEHNSVERKEKQHFPSKVPKTLLGRPAVSAKCQSSPAASMTSNYKKGLLISNLPHVTQS